MRSSRLNDRKFKIKFMKLHSSGMLNGEMQKELSLNNGDVWRYLRNLGLEANKADKWYSGWEPHIKEMWETGSSAADIAETFEAKSKSYVYDYVNRNGLVRKASPMKKVITLTGLRDRIQEITEPHYLKRVDGKEFVVIPYDQYKEMTQY